MQHMNFCLPFSTMLVLASGRSKTRIVGGELVPPDSDDFRYHASLARFKLLDRVLGNVVCGATLISLKWGIKKPTNVHSDAGVTFFSSFAPIARPWLPPTVFWDLDTRALRTSCWLASSTSGWPPDRSPPESGGGSGIGTHIRNSGSRRAKSRHQRVSKTVSYTMKNIRFLYLEIPLFRNNDFDFVLYIGRFTFLLWFWYSEGVISLNIELVFSSWI